jgi:hypothetical protein
MLYSLVKIKLFDTSSFKAVRASLFSYHGSTNTEYTLHRLLLAAWSQSVEHSAGVCSEVTTSSTEAEYVAASETCKEIA